MVLVEKPVTFLTSRHSNRKLRLNAEHTYLLFKISINSDKIMAVAPHIISPLHG